MSLQTKNPFWALALEQNASDIHVVSNNVPMVRINGVMTPVSTGLMTPEQVKEQILEFLPQKDYDEKLIKTGDVDCAFSLPDGTRFRINAHMVSGKPAYAARLIPREAPTIADVMLPPVVMDISVRRLSYVRRYSQGCTRSKPCIKSPTPSAAPATSIEPGRSSLRT